LHATVSIARCATYDRDRLAECLQAALAPFGGMASMVRSGQQVILKPNLLCPAGAEEAVTTHPEFVGAVAVAVREVGGDPIVADSPAFGTLGQVAEKCGLRAVCDELALPLMPLRRSVVEAVETARGVRTYRISREVTEADVVLNLPKLKAHRQVGLSAGIKNCYGCVPGKRKIVGHLRGGPVDMNFARMIVEHYRLVSPELTLVDGILAMEGKGPRLGRPRQLGLVVASVDAVAIDAVLCELLRAPRDYRMLVDAARELGVGETDPDAIDVVGVQTDNVSVSDWQWPPLIGTQFGLPRVVKSWAKNLWLTRFGFAKARPTG
jgi:uncharacterized protein (DUF362 family)